MKKKIVLKVGSSTLTAGTDRISRGKIEDIARQLVELREAYDVIIVSSGAIATARQFLTNNSLGENVVASRQAMSAIGQPKLIQIYAEVFSDFNIKIAQCLMTYRAFDNEHSRTNTLNTIDTLLQHNHVPIINENDTVAVEELTLGDNDKLSALVAGLVEADILVLASDIDGVFDKNPHLHNDAQLISRVNDLEEVTKYAQHQHNELGTGGMHSKFEAARICFEHGIDMRIVNGGKANFLTSMLADELPHTRFAN